MTPFGINNSDQIDFPTTITTIAGTAIETSNNEI
jgi:hypothetical protein